MKHIDVVAEMFVCLLNGIQFDVATINILELLAKFASARPTAYQPRIDAGNLIEQPLMEMLDSFMRNFVTGFLRFVAI
jgi:hypothetical protein